MGVCLPAGYRNSSSLNNAGSNGNYWSSTPNSSNTNNAYNLNFNSSNVNRNNNNRYNGQSVRPVSELTSIPGLPARHFLLLSPIRSHHSPLQKIFARVLELVKSYVPSPQLEPAKPLNNAQIGGSFFSDHY